MACVPCRFELRMGILLVLIGILLVMILDFFQLSLLVTHLEINCFLSQHLNNLHCHFVGYGCNCCKETLCSAKRILQVSRYDLHSSREEELPLQEWELPSGLICVAISLLEIIRSTVSASSMPSGFSSAHIIRKEVCEDTIMQHFNTTRI